MPAIKADELKWCTLLTTDVNYQQAGQQTQQQRCFESVHAITPVPAFTK